MKKTAYIFLILFVIYIGFKIQSNTEEIKTDNENNVVIEKLSYVTEENKVIEDTTKEEIVTDLKGYKVIAKLEIPKINLITHVLNETNDNALKISVTKYWGSNPNEVGNFCVAGHNFKKDNMFRNIKNLSEGDKIFLTDLSERKVEYKVYENSTVEPANTSSLSQKTNGKREITLITCTLDSKLRVVIKAIEV